jgi:cold shock CspA family protein
MTHATRDARPFDSDDADRQPVDVPDSQRLTGVVVRRMETHGFCFIKVDDGREFFAHLSNFVGGQWDRATEGQSVSFVPTTTAKGLRALQVKVKP